MEQEQQGTKEQQQPYKGADRRQTHHSPYQGEDRRKAQLPFGEHPGSPDKGDPGMSMQERKDEQEERTRQRRLEMGTDPISVGKR